jgi:hypothetical protein
VLYGCHGLMVPDEVGGTSVDFVTGAALILCGVPDPFVPRKGEC